jgi:hypothetical protein
MNVPLKFIRNYWNFLWSKPNNSNISLQRKQQILLLHKLPANETLLEMHMYL